MLNDPATSDPLLRDAAWLRGAASVRLFDALEADGAPARFVGGCVRDTLAGIERELWDLDVCTPEVPERVGELLNRARIKHVPTGLKHGTITALVAGQAFEITTLRRDARTDGRHATVVFTSDFQEDAARRDFTINAMSVDRTGRLFDYFGGRADLAAGRLRFVGDPRTRIAEDYLRVLRFFRFYARYGSFSPDAPTAAALEASLGGLDRLSGERVGQEALGLLATAAPGQALELMASLGVLGWLLEARPVLAPVHAFLEREPQPEALVRLAALVRAAGADVERLACRLRLSSAARTRLCGLVGVPMLNPIGLDAADLRRALVSYGREATKAAGLFALAAAGAPVAAARDWSGDVEAAAMPVFPLAGRDVLALGLPAGPLVGKALAAVRETWMSAGCVADAADLRRELQAVVASLRGDA